MHVIAALILRRHAAAVAALVTLFIVVGGGASNAASYEELVAQAKDGKAIDYAALRNAYAQSKRYDAYNTDITSLRGPLQKAFADGDCENAIKQGEAILEKNYVFIDAHYFLGVCHRRLGQAARSERHLAAARGLMRAILATGDGKTPESAFVVISVAEEYNVIGVLGGRRPQQALINKDGHSYDRLTVETKSGDKEEIYFNIDRVMRAAADMLKPKQ